jgi:poly-gamma-glutamate capsule biosynthesis protein CapA/YwtB (metallophosphatase superfamily)
MSHNQMKGAAIKILSVVLLFALGGAAAFVIHHHTGWFRAEPELPPAYVMPELPQPKETSLFFAGDIMLSRNVGTAIVREGAADLPFQKTKDAVRRADISFANLESPFNDEGPRRTEGLVFKAEPDAVDGLTAAGFDILSTANNHSYDQGKNGITYTLDWLRQHGIKTVGTGLDCHDGVIMEANGIKFGYLAYSYAAFNDGGRVPDPLVCDWNDLDQVKSDIAALKPQADFVIVSSHMGAEYKREPEPANAAAARATIDAGADMFIGHHPHWVQTIEEYEGKYIFYSLGNFVFDQMWSQDTREGLGVKVLFKDKILSRIELMPVVIDDYCCPRWADETETKSILAKINLTSPVLMDKND